MTDLRARLDAHLGDRYGVVRELGSGGMATVFLATDAKHAREVALKVLRPEVAGALGSERFLREIETVARLTHPHILPLHDSGEAGGLLYYVMPYVEGESLRERLEREGPLRIEEALWIAAECAEALEHAHQEGIIHRDLKPANILLNQGHAVVADFGIGRAVEDAADAQVLTRTGISLGTVGYMSPEQASGAKAVDARSDVYALGCVLYEMLTGERAFPGRTAQAVMARQLTEGPPSVSMLRRSIPEAVERVLHTALQPNPADRYGTAAEFRAELMVSRQAGPSRARRESLTLRPRPAVAGVGLLILGALAYTAFVYAGGGTAEPGMPEIRSLAVLPLENLAPDPEAEQYFADGLTEALTAELGQISALTVVSRTSTKRYRGTEMAMPEIARELGVDGLIEGAVRQAGDEVDITVYLVHGATGEQLWSQSYQRSLSDILALQDEVAWDVVEEIRVAVTQEEGARLASSPSVDPDAYRLWLRGNFHSATRSEESIRRALALYQEALAVDPGYAPAYAGVARAYLWLGSWFASVDPRDVLPRAREAIDRARALDPALPEAHLGIAHVRLFFEWDWVGAERSLRQAIALNPSHGNAHASYTDLLIFLGRFEEAVDMGRRAVELDPLSPPAYFGLAVSLDLAGRENEAMEQYREGFELAPGHNQGHMVIAELHYARRGEFEQALSHAEQAVATNETPHALGRLGYLYGAVGNQSEARDILSRLMNHRREAYAPATAVAFVHLGLGQHEEALGWLETAYEERDMNLVWLKEGWRFAPLRDEPRYQELVRRMDFPGN